MTSQARLSIVIRFKNEGVLTDYMNDFFMELSDNVKRRLKPIFVIQRESISKSQNSYISKIYGPYERFKALVEGIWEAIGEKVLILDADQVISESLLVELLESKADCIFIKERSHDNNVVGMLMNMNREGVEQIFMSNWDVSRFFIPRCYNLELIRKAVDGIPLPTIETINNGEDLILYYQAMDYIQTYKIAKNIILHRDPDMLTQVRKSFSYGKLKKQISKYELTDNVFLPGFMEADTKAHYLKQSRFYVLSSSREGFSISTLEAMQFGCIPIVSRPSSSEVFGVSHFVTDGVNGFYYDVANLKNFADVLEKALKIGLRTEYQFKRTAYDTSGNFEWGKLLDKLTL